MAFREFEIELDGGLCFEVEASISVRDGGEHISVSIDGVRSLPEEGEPIEILTLAPDLKDRLCREVIQSINDNETLRDLEREDNEAARDEEAQRRIDQAKEDRER